MVAAYNLEAADDLSVPPKHPDSDLVEVNKIGWEPSCRGRQNGSCSQNIYKRPPKTSYLWKKMRHYETFLVV